MYKIITVCVLTILLLLAGVVLERTAAKSRQQVREYLQRHENMKGTEAEMAEVRRVYEEMRMQFAAVPSAERKERIEALRVKLVPMDEELSWLTATCSHRYAKAAYGGSRCEICGERGDWFCPSNPPVNQCEYDRNGVCVHCGTPSERK